MAIEKKLIVEYLNKCIHSLIVDVETKKITVLSDCSSTLNLCSVIEAVFLHGQLRNESKIFGRFNRYKPSYEYEFWTIVKEFIPKNFLDLYESREVKLTNVGYSRLFVRHVLNEATLFSYIDSIQFDSNKLNRCYSKNSLMRDQEQMETVCGLLKSLEHITFKLDTDSSLLNTWVNSNALKLAGLDFSPTNVVDFTNESTNVSSSSVSTANIDVQSSESQTDVLSDEILSTSLLPSITYSSSLPVNICESIEEIVINENAPSDSEDHVWNDSMDDNNDMDDAVEQDEQVNSKFEDILFRQNQEIFNDIKSANEVALSSEVSAAEDNSVASDNRDIESEICNLPDDTMTSEVVEDDKNDQTIAYHELWTRQNSVKEVSNNDQKYASKLEEDSDKKLSTDADRNFDYKFDLSSTSNEEENCVVATFGEIDGGSGDAIDNNDISQNNSSNDSSRSSPSMPKVSLFYNTLFASAFDFMRHLIGGSSIYNYFQVKDPDEKWEHLGDSLVVVGNREIDRLIDIYPGVEFNADDSNINVFTGVCFKCKNKLEIGKCFIDYYDGQLYCTDCEIVTSAIIPRDVKRNWDFNCRPVCETTKRFLSGYLMQPNIDLATNPVLFDVIPQLSQMQKLRHKISLLWIQISSCNIDVSTKIQKALFPRDYMLGNLSERDVYSLEDLIIVQTGALQKTLSSVINKIAVPHVTNCHVCKMKALSCDECKNENKLIYTFEFDSYTQCTTPNCKSVIHNACKPATVSSFYCKRCLQFLRNQEPITLTSYDAVNNY